MVSRTTLPAIPVSGLDRAWPVGATAHCRGVRRAIAGPGNSFTQTRPWTARLRRAATRRDGGHLARQQLTSMGIDNVIRPSCKTSRGTWDRDMGWWISVVAALHYSVVFGVAKESRR